MKKKIPFLVSLLLLAVILLAACQPSGQPSGGNDGSGGEMVPGQEATVESLKVMILESFPVQVQAIVSGYFPDGCVQLDTIKVDQSGNDLILTINTLRPAGDVACTEALVPFEENVPLDVYGLPAGTYTVIAQDKTASFDLSVDNVPQEPPTEEIPSATVYLEKMTVNLMESFPVQVNVDLSGNLPDSCTKVQDITSSREGNVFTIELTASRPDGDVACATVLTPFDETVSLDVEGLPAGEYTVNAGDLTETFTLEIDNIAQLEPSSCREPQDGETRVEAIFRSEGFGFCFSIPEGFTEEEGGQDADWLIKGQNYGAEGSLPIQASLKIGLTFLNGFSFEDYIRQQKSVLNMPASLDQVDAVWGNYPAVIIDGYPLENTSRIIWVDHGSQAFQLVFAPMEPALFPMATEDMESLYQLVMESWVFLGE